MTLCSFEIQRSIAAISRASKDVKRRQRRPVLNAPHLVALVRAGAVFRDGVPIERPEPAAA
jgi:hypothetical protein